MKDTDKTSEPKPGRRFRQLLFLTILTSTAAASGVSWQLGLATFSAWLLLATIGEALPD